MNRSKVLATKSVKVIQLFELLKELKSDLDEAFFEELNRRLPFAELLFDRWERAEELGFGKGTSVYDSCLIFGEVSVADNTWIGPNTILDGSGGLKNRM